MLSCGFLQLTLRHGKLQEWILAAPAAFARFGVAVDPQRTYTWGTAKPQKAVSGAPDPEELRWDGWAERFYLAGLDDQVIAAECGVAAQWLDRHLKGLHNALRVKGMGWAVDAFRVHYDRSPYMRGMFQASYNNLPAVARRAAADVLSAERKSGGLTTDRFAAEYGEAIIRAYAAAGLKSRGDHIVEKTKSGRRPCRTGPSARRGRRFGQPR